MANRGGDSGFTFNSKEALTNSAEIIAQGPNKQPKGRKKAKKAAAARKKAIDKIEKAQEKALALSRRREVRIGHLC